MTKTMNWMARAAMGVLGFIIATSGVVQAQARIAPGYASSYQIVDLGSAPGVSPLYGGLTLEAGTTNTLLIGGLANVAGGQIYSIGVTRDGSGHINGFSGTAANFASAPNIDGGLAYGPGGVLFATGFPNNRLLEYKPGSTSPDKTIDLSTFGIGSSVGTLAFDPTGAFKIASYNGGGYYNVTLTADGTGTYNIGTATLGDDARERPRGYHLRSQRLGPVPYALSLARGIRPQHSGRLQP